MNIIGRIGGRSLVLATILEVAGQVPHVALAGELKPSASVKIKLTEHALDSRQSVASTYTRIRNAARSVCGYADRAFREEQDAWDDCVKETIRHSVTQIDNAELTTQFLVRSRAWHGQNPKIAERHASAPADRLLLSR